MGGVIAPAMEHRLVVNGTQTHRRKHGRSLYLELAFAGIGQPDPAGHVGGTAVPFTSPNLKCAATGWLRPMVWPSRRWAATLPFEQGIVGLVGQREELINLADAPPTPVSNSCPMWPKRRFAPSSALPSCISARWWHSGCAAEGEPPLR